MKKENGMQMLKRALQKKSKKSWMDSVKNTKKKRKGKSFGQGPAMNPKGSKPMKNPQDDMRTWKQPKTNSPTRSATSRPAFTPGARFAKRKKMQLEEKNPQETVRTKRMCKRSHKHKKACR